MRENREIKRGEIYLVDLGIGKGSVQSHKRPVLIVSNEMANKYSPVVIVVPLTSKQTKKPLPTHVGITKLQYPIPKDSVILCEQVMTVDRSQFLSTKPMTRLNEMDSRKVNKALVKSLAIQPDVAIQTTNNNCLSAI